MRLPEILAVLSGAEVFTLTLYGEARGEPVEGIIAVASVIRNRVRDGRWGSTYRDVCLAPRQFSCWRPAGGASNHAHLMGAAALVAAGGQPDDTQFRQCAWVARGITEGVLVDRVKGATHYYSPTGMVPKGTVPAWAKGRTPVAVVAGHKFFARIT